MGSPAPHRAHTFVRSKNCSTTSPPRAGPADADEGAEGAALATPEAITLRACFFW